MPKAKTIGILLFPGFETLDVYGPVQMWGRLPDHRIVMISQDGGPVESSQGIETAVAHSFATAPQLEIVMVPGGMGTRTEIDNPAILDFISVQDRSSDWTTSVCTGAALLARAGILDGRAATSNKLAFDWVASQGSAVCWQRHARWVADGKYMTASVCRPGWTWRSTSSSGCMAAQPPTMQRGWPNMSGMTIRPMTPSRRTANDPVMTMSMPPGAAAGCASCADAGLLGPAEDRDPYEDREDVPEAIRALYERAIVIDALATPNTFNVDYPPAGRALTAAQIDNVRRSGITAVNCTIFGTDVADHREKIRLVKADIARHPDRLMLIERPSDIATAKASGRLGIIIGFQGLEFLQADLPLIESFGAASVLIMQPTYNQESELGSGCLATGHDPGLKPLGHEAVRRINRLSSLVDLSHSHPQTALDAIAASADPVIVSHSACHALHPHPRNHPDEVLRAVAGSGGVFGIYLMPFLGKEPAPASRALVTRHILHALNVCGEDHVGIGSDNSITPLRLDQAYHDALAGFVAQRRRDGAASPSEGLHPFMVPGLNSPRRLEIISWDLARAGCPDAAIEKILGGNFLRVFDRVWKG